MDYSAAVDEAVREMSAAADPVGGSVEVALRLAVHLWELCDSRGGSAAEWGLFGTAVQAAADGLYLRPRAIAILVDEVWLPDTREVRSNAARLATATAERLRAASGDLSAETGRRWAWEQAAARLDQAAAFLVDPP